MVRRLPLLLVLVAVPGWSDGTAQLMNISKADWHIQQVPDGSSTGGSLTIKNGGASSPALKGGLPFDKFTVSDPLKLPAGQEFDLAYSYWKSFQLRFLVTDKNGEWAEYMTRLGITDTFKSGQRYTLLYSSLAAKTLTEDGSAEPGLAATRSAVLTDYQRSVSPKADGAKPGVITLAMDWFTLPPFQPKRLAATPKVDLPAKAACITFFFNTTDVDLTVNGLKKQVTKVIRGYTEDTTVSTRGAMIFCDLRGVEFNRRDETGARHGQPVLAAHSVTRIIFQPDSKGRFDTDFDITDGHQHFLYRVGNAPNWSMVRMTMDSLKSSPAGPKPIVEVEDAQPGGLDLTFKQ